jgi:hypothetical protein
LEIIWMTRHIGQAVAQAAFDIEEAARHSAVTIAARLPIFVGFAVAPSAAALTEWNEACTEKVAAGLEGAVAAMTAWNAMLIGAVFQPLTPVGLASGTLRVLAEASRPAHSKVRANAARLSRR